MGKRLAIDYGFGERVRVTAPGERNGAVGIVTVIVARAGVVGYGVSQSDGRETFHPAEDLTAADPTD